MERSGKVGRAALAEVCSCRRGPLSGALGCVKRACREGHCRELPVLSHFLFHGCVFFSAASPAALPALQFAVVLPVLCSR